MIYVPISHTNPAFREMIIEIDNLLTRMFELTAQTLASTCQALAHDDLELARKTIAQDKEVNEIETQVSISVATTIARHQPVAHDLHALMGSVKIAQELERMCDHGKNICRRLPYLLNAQSTAFQSELIELGKVIVTMLNEFIAAKEAQDHSRAKAVHSMDKQANQHYRAIVERALGGENSDEPRGLVNALFIAKDFERIGDRIKNLAELIHYQRTGEKLDVDDDDDIEVIATNEARQ